MLPQLAITMNKSKSRGRRFRFHRHKRFLQRKKPLSSKSAVMDDFWPGHEVGPFSLPPSLPPSVMNDSVCRSVSSPRSGWEERERNFYEVSCLRLTVVSSPLLSRLLVSVSGVGKATVVDAVTLVYPFEVFHETDGEMTT